MNRAEKFNLAFYIDTLMRLLKDPRAFYQTIPDGLRANHSLVFLLVSSILFTTASLAINFYESPLMMGGVLLINAMGMVVIASGLCYLVMVALWGRCLAYRKMFSIFAFASGITLTAAWIPLSFWITEPWKWWLVGVGITTVSSLSKRQTLLIIVLSVGLLMAIFWSVHRGMGI